MKKLREKFSRYLAIVLTLALVLQPGTTAVAETAASGNWEGTAVTAPVKQKASPSNTAENTGEDTGTEDDEEFEDEDLEYDLASDSDAEEEEEPDGELEDDLELATMSDAISLFSFMPPIDEVYAYVFLNDYPEDKLDAVPVELILSRMQDRDGNPIDVPDGGRVVWTYYWDNDGEIIEDEAHAIDRSGTVDLVDESGYISSHISLDLLLGSGNQLDKESIRYNIEIYLSNRISEKLNVELVRTTGENAGDVYSPKFIEDRSPLSQEGMPVIREICYADLHQEGDIYSLTLDSIIKNQNRDSLKVEAYQLKDFLDAYKEGREPDHAITDQLLTAEGGGYTDSFAPADSIADSNVFCLVYSNPETNRIFYCRAYEFVITHETPELGERFYAVENNQMVPVAEETGSVYMRNRLGSFSVEVDREQDYFGKETYTYGYITSIGLKPGYPLDREYYFMLEENENIEKVFYGYYQSLAEAAAAGAEDITSAALPPDRSMVPCGYKIPKVSGDSEVVVFDFTVCFKDGTCWWRRIKLYETYEEDYVYDDKPLVNMEDPYLTMYGARNDGDALAVENNYNYTMDTYYGYGYQTVFITNMDADLAHLVPYFSCPDDVTIHSGDKQESGKSEKDFSNGPVAYQAHIGNKKRNYQVTFAKKQSGPSLFVNGPDKREVFLTKYFDYHHDIMIANIGDSDLTGLSVELKDAQHVKLDDYWVVGGQGNDTLGAFTDTHVDYQYVELANIAKVRLVPDGEGELSGTLVITADGQEPVEIELQGYASNPLITSDGLGDAVKYVPYSYMIATNNMYYEVQETYRLTAGKLPRGLELKPGTGEIYGVPLETGDFDIQVEVTYQNGKFEPSYQDLTLTVRENTNKNVYNASDEGYEIEEHIGTETAAGSRDYLLTEISDQLYVSAGVIEEFEDLWLNGEKLIEGTDYTKVSGSTRMTIRSQTFERKGVNGTNTIAAEFRTGTGSVKTLRRTSQNFRMENKRLSGNYDSSSSSDDNDTTSKTTADGYSDSSWSRDEQGWRCKNPDGTWLTNTWKKLPYQGTMAWYYFKEDGYMATGWMVQNGRTYYLNMGPDGTFGAMSNSWKYIDDAWYYFDGTAGENEGAMLHDGWAYLPYQGTTEWYYFQQTGKMATGWISDEGKYYYLYPVADGTRGRMLTGWQQIDGKWYYFYGPEEESHGAMAANTRIGEYRVGSSGARVE
ncbi:MAG: putative Ig domain-containing protein [Eubacteriales bacterium]|nr:putative Ig domain-containing protein [Eubacteriales bacterium]